MSGRPRLNPSQEAAASWRAGPLLVLAGPGSGKTATLTERVARILEESPDDSFRILCLTFTRKAASEMRERLLSVMPAARERVLLTTFHSFAGDILRQHGSYFGFSPSFDVIAEKDRAVLIKPILEEGSFPRFVSAEKAVFALDILLRNGHSEEEITSQVSDPDLARQLQELFSRYQKALVESNAVDYSSMLYLCTRLLLLRPRLAQQLRTVYKYICVDEFQDTNLAQYRLLRALASDKASNLFIVADDDQVIYQWNGASPSRVQELAKDYELAVIQLPENYRCPATVVDLANALITHNAERSSGKQPLKSMRGDSERDEVTVRRFANDEDEATGVAKLIKERINTGVRHNQIAVLARNTKLLERIQSAMTSAGVQAHLQKRRTDFESAPMRFLVASLKLAAVPTDEDLAAAAAKALSDCVEEDIPIEDVSTLAAQANGDYLAALKILTSSKAGRARAVGGALARLNASSYSAFVKELLRLFDDASGSTPNEATDVFVDYDVERGIWSSFIRELGGDSEALELPLNQLLQEFALANKTPEPPDSAVRCMTIHASKGLEFDHVYLTGMAEDQLPSFQSKKAGDDSREMQEERRNCFVAITRTRASLTLTFAARYNGWPKLPSRFLGEMGLSAD